MLKATKKALEKKLNEKGEALQIEDIIVEKISYEETVNELGEITIKPKVKMVNLSKKISETSKLAKSYQAEEKLKEIEAIFTK